MGDVGWWGGGGLHTRSVILFAPRSLKRRRCCPRPQTFDMSAEDATELGRRAIYVRACIMHVPVSCLHRPLICTPLCLASSMAARAPQPTPPSFPLLLLLISPSCPPALSSLPPLAVCLRLLAAQVLIRRPQHATHRDAYSGGMINVFHVTETGWKKISADDSGMKMHYHYAEEGFGARY